MTEYQSDDNSSARRKKRHDGRGYATQNENHENSCHSDDYNPNAVQDKDSMGNNNFHDREDNHSDPMRMRPAGVFARDSTGTRFFTIAEGGSDKSNETLWKNRWCTLSWYSALARERFCVTRIGLHTMHKVINIYDGCLSSLGECRYLFTAWTQSAPSSAPTIRCSLSMVTHQHNILFDLRGQWVHSVDFDVLVGNIIIYPDLHSTWTSLSRGCFFAQQRK